MPINYLRKIQLGDFSDSGYRISPSDEIAAAIEGFYVFSKEAKSDTHLVFNDGYPVLVFMQNSNDTVSVIGQKDPTEINGAWASAGSIKNVYIRYNDNIAELFIVRFHPAAFYQLFGVTTQYFRHNPVASLDHIIKANTFDLAEFFMCNSINEKVLFIEKYIQGSFKLVDARAVFDRTLNYIHKLKGKSTVREITDIAGVNYKWLERNFKKNVGLLPKEYIQLQRFIHAYADFAGTKDVDLMRIAISNGYYDSNHFLKDFKAYTGKTPMEYLKLQL